MSGKLLNARIFVLGSLLSLTDSKYLTAFFQPFLGHVVLVVWEIDGLRYLELNYGLRRMAPRKSQAGLIKHGYTHFLKKCGSEFAWDYSYFEQQD